MPKNTTFYEALQNDDALDLRDVRGKRHILSLILTEFVISLLCHRDGVLSSIWRHMKAHHIRIVEELNITDTAPKKRYLVLICHGY